MMAVADHKGNPYETSTNPIPPPPPFGIEGTATRASVGVLLRIVDGEGCCSESDTEPLDEGGEGLVRLGGGGAGSEPPKLKMNVPSSECPPTSASKVRPTESVYSVPVTR